MNALVVVVCRVYALSMAALSRRFRLVTVCSRRLIVSATWVTCSVLVVACMVRTGLEKSWNLTLDLKSHGILCWPGKMAFCLEKSLKISGSH